MPTAIIWPLLALITWTFLVVVHLLYVRFGAYYRGRVKASDFRNGESAHIPPDVLRANRAFVNLLEMPTLFYVVGVLYLVTLQTSHTVLVLAWLYVVLRITHSVIYLTLNHVLLRFAAYAASSVVLMLMVALLVLRLTS